MPKKNPGMTPEEQSKRFKADARKLIKAGDLNPTEADAAFARALAGVKLDREGRKD